MSRRRQHFRQVREKMPLLISLLTVKRHAMRGLMRANECGTELGLLCVPLSVEGNQRMAEPPAHPRPGRGIEKRGPDHITGDGEATATDGEDDAGGQYPKHSDEASQEKARLEQADAQVSGKIR